MRSVFPSENILTDKILLIESVKYKRSQVLARGVDKADLIEYIHSVLLRRHKVVWDFELGIGRGAQGSAL